MSEELGTARLLLTIDATDFDAVIARSKNAAAGLGTEAESAFDKLNDKAKRAATGLGKYADAIGRTADEQKILNAIGAGVPASIIDGAIAKINERRAAIEATAQSARDLAAAERAAFTANAAAEASATESRLALRKAAENDELREQQRVVATLTQQLYALEAAEQQQSDFALAAAKAAENDALREQQRVVSVLTQRFYELEAAEAQVARGNDFVASLQQQALAINKTRAELLELKAAEMGVSSQAAPFIAQLKAQEAALKTSGIAFNQYGLSVKQTQAALRQVPAQLTDIFVSLQGGQAPLTVLLQQGGQLKDVFGGVVPAVKALGSAVLGLITPYTLLAAGIAAVAFGYIKGSQEADNFARAITNSGNRAGTTAGQLGELRQELDGMAGITAGEAAAALTEVVATGKITADQLEQVTRAALATQEATGKAVKDTVAEFVELGKDPVTAILKLNESQNFLTVEVYNSIRALQQQGDAIGAAQLAVETYATTLQDRSTKIVENLGYIQSAWKGVKSFTEEAIDALLSYGRASDDTSELLALTNEQTRLFEQIAEGGGAEIRARERLLQIGDEKKAIVIRQGEERALQEAENERKAGEAARLSLAVEAAKYATDRDKYEAQRLRIGQIANTAYVQAIIAGDSKGAAAIRANAEEALAGLKKDYDSKVKPDRSVRIIDNAEARAQLQALKDLLAQQRAAIEGDTKELEAAYRAKLVPIEDYYEQMRALVREDARVQEEAIVAQIAVLQSRNVAGKDSIDVARQLATLESDLAKVRAETASKEIVLNTESAAALAERTRSIRDYIDALDEANLQLERNVNAQIEAIGQGQREADQARKVADAYDDLRRELIELKKEREDGKIGQKEYEDEVEAARRGTNERVRIIEDGYRRMLLAEANWRNGVSAGVANWVEENRNVAEQIEAITSNALDGAVDTLTQFVTTGKLLWKELLADILKQIAKFFLNQAVLNFLNFLKERNGGGGQDSGGGFLSGLVSAVVGAFTGGGGAGGVSSSSKLSNESISSERTQAAAKAMSGTGGSVVNLSVVTNIDNNGNATTRTSNNGQDSADYAALNAQIAFVTQGIIQKEMRQGGKLWRAGVTAK